MTLVDQHEVVVAEVVHRDPLDALPLGQLVQVDDLDRLEEVRHGVAGKHARVEPARVQLPLVLRRHLLVGGQQHDVVELSPRSIEVVPVLQDVRVHQQRLARPRGALEGENPQIVARILRQRHHLPRHRPHPSQIPAQRLGILEVPVKIVLGEQQRDVLMGLPCPPVLSGHAQPVAVCDDVPVVLPELFVPNLRPLTIPIQCQRRRVTTPVAATRVLGNVTKPREHRIQVRIAEFTANESMQNPPALERRILSPPSRWSQ